MKTPERFDRAIKALVQAFFNDTLISVDCRACAVGNMVAYGKGEKLQKCSIPWIGFETKSGYDNGAWYTYLHRCSDYQNYHDQAVDNISATGYSAEQLLMIEDCFMDACRVNSYINKHSKSEIMEDQFNGLMAVVDVLCQIEGLDSQEYKKAFEYTPEFQPVNS